MRRYYNSASGDATDRADPTGSNPSSRDCPISCSLNGSSCDVAAAAPSVSRPKWDTTAT